MKDIVFFTHDSLYSARVLEKLIASSVVNVKAIVLSTCVLRRGGNALVGSLQLIRKTGFRYALYQFLATQCYPFLQGPLKQTSMIKLAKIHYIPVYKTSDVNSISTLNFVMAKAPLAVSCYFNQRFKAAIIKLFDEGIVNMHPSYLPHNRGVDPLFFARLRGEKTGGYTLHLIDNHLDTGSILYQSVYTLDHDKAMLAEQLALFEEATIYLIQVLANFNTFLPGYKQKDGGNYDSWPKAEEVKKVSGLLSLGRLKQKCVYKKKKKS